MSNIHRTVALFVLVVFITACIPQATSTPLGTDTPEATMLLATNTLTATSTPKATATLATATPSPSFPPDAQIVRYPRPADYQGLNVYTELPRYDRDSIDSWPVDLRSSYLVNLDLSKSKDNLFYADFDSQTRWPPADKLPADFDWQKIMELGKDPGLGIRALHAQGITGKGIGIAIIDQTLLVEHAEYSGRLRVYEEQDITREWYVAQMHGPAVASIAVGKSVGVAPEADLYFIANGLCITNERTDFNCLAKSVRRIIEINKSLPAERKIRVLSMSIGWSPKSTGYAEITAAVKEAKAAGIFVISTSLAQTDNLYFHGLGREPLNDPNQFESFVPGLWWEKDFYAGTLLNSYPWDLPKQASLLLVPMDSRTTASPTGAQDYVFYRGGGWSWSVPYLAGTYALAAQVKPDITPKEFWAIALKTGRTIHIQHEEQDYELGVILDPQALIEALKSK